MAKTNYTTSALKSRTVRVREVSESIQYGHTASAIARKAGPRFLRITDIQDGKVDWESVPSCDIVAEDVPKYRLSKGDLVFARTGATTGKSFLIRDCPEAVFASYLIRVRASSDVDPRYLALFFKSPDYWQQIERGKRGIGQPNVNGKILGEIELPLPPLDEQQRIVAEIEKQFTRLDAGVASLKRVQIALKRDRASVLKAACGGRLVPTEAELARKENRSYETGEQLLQRILKARREKCNRKGKYKEPAAPNFVDLPELPEGWTWATMPQLGELSRGKSKHRPRDDAKLYGGPYPFVQTGDIRKSGGTIREHHQNYSEAGLQQSRLWPAGTLCITIAANIAETGILTYPACFPDSVVGFLQENSPIITRYVEFFLRTAKERIESFAPATAQKNINLDVLQKVAIPLPPLAEQTRIVEGLEKRLSVVDKLEAILNVNLHRGNRLKQSVLASAFQASRHLM
jgi:type I restriction enzyme S subunit